MWTGSRSSMASLASTPPVGSARMSDFLVSPEDRQLLSDCLQGSPAAWDSFVDRFAGLIAFVIDRTAAQRHVPLAAADREDLIAQTLLEIVQHDAAVLRAFRGNSTLATYLAVIARRLAVRGLSRMGARRRLAAGTPTDAVDVSHIDNGQSRLDDKEHADVLLEKLARTDPTGARLVQLYYIEGRGYGEISRLTGIPLGSIGPMIGRARQKLRERDE